MNKTLIAVSLLAMTSAFTACNNEKAETEAATPATAQQPSEEGLKIAYVEVDTLMSQYQLCKDFNEISNVEGENIQRTLANKQKALQQHAQSMQQKYQSNGFQSQEELDRAQASLQKEQQDLEELGTRLNTSFLEQQQKYNEEMRDSIRKFLNSYNKNKKFDLILSKQGDNILYANTALDITNDVVKGLNKRYKASAEVTAKLKGRGEKKTESEEKKK